MQDSPVSTRPRCRRLQLRWAFGLADSERARGAPAVAGGRVFVGARNGSVFALEAKTGCTVWSSRRRTKCAPRCSLRLSVRKGAGLRTSVTPGPTSTHWTPSAGQQIWRTRLERTSRRHADGFPSRVRGAPVRGTEFDRGAHGSLQRVSRAAHSAAASQRLTPPTARGSGRPIRSRRSPLRASAIARGVMQHGPLRCRDLVGPDGRHEAAARVRDDRRQLLGPAHARQRRHHRLRSRHGRATVVPAVHGGGRPTT